MKHPSRSLGRWWFFFVAIAVLAFTACSGRTSQHGSGGASGGGGANGLGGSAPPLTIHGDGIAPRGGGGAQGMGAYFGGDGIAPRSGGGGFYGGSGAPSGGAGGVDPNCFMRCGQGNAISSSAGGAGGARDTSDSGTDLGSGLDGGAGNPDASDGGAACPETQPPFGSACTATAMPGCVYQTPMGTTWCYCSDGTMACM